MFDGTCSTEGTCGRCGKKNIQGDAVTCDSSQTAAIGSKLCLHCIDNSDECCSCNAHTFDTNGIKLDGCEDGCAVVINAALNAITTCTTPSNSRVSACKVGYFKTVGGDSTSADTCTICANGGTR